MDYVSIQLVLLALHFALVAGIAIAVPLLWKGAVFVPERGRQEMGAVFARCRDVFIPVGAITALIMAESVFKDLLDPTFMTTYDILLSRIYDLWAFVSLYLLLLVIGLAVLLGIQGRDLLAPSVSVISGLFRDALLVLSFVVFIVLALVAWLLVGTVVTALVLFLGVLYLSVLYFYRAEKIRDEVLGDDWVI
ncbi:hypothetical protein [Corynebacterium sputi]|uniref:hypothetical protein n=1 Tax=Corynebacterium sputi TaxID=489915 RepID=UPI00047E6758|nr:hypothetical protein [Corynebacterium sputi]